jgi:hypothetical protein
MAANAHGRRACTIGVEPREVDAGAELMVTVEVRCAHACDLTGQRVSFRAADDAELASAELGERNGETCVARAVLRSPSEVLDHVCRAVLSADALHEEVATTFSFATKPHAMSVHVWDVPSAIAAGECFRFNVGVKCSAACNLTGRQMRILDHAGAPVVVVSLHDLWPGTSALYFAEVEAQAPPMTGDHQWRIAIAGSHSGVPHADGSCDFTVQVVGAPDHEVTIEAFDRDRQTPIADAHVLMHPYRAFTDANGVAKLKVVRGSYKVFVSGFNYIGFEDSIDVLADVAVRAELAAELEGQEDYGY